LQLIFSQESDSKPFLEKPTTLEGERENMHKIISEKEFVKLLNEMSKIYPLSDRGICKMLRMNIPGGAM
jgi:hypothetical protein